MDREELVKMLLSAFADEVIAHYMYFIATQVLKNRAEEKVVEAFTEIAKDELEDHAANLLKRLRELGVEPPSFGELWNLSRCRHPELPRGGDVYSWLRASIEAERCAIEYYREMRDRVRKVDHVTRDLIDKILEDEVEHESVFSKLASGKG